MSVVAKWGHSLAVRLPKSIQKESRIQEGDEVDFVVVDNGGILINPVSRKKRLEALLEAITPENLHSETDWGHPVGGEIW